MSHLSAVLASFKQGQKRALQVQAEVRQERDDKLAKAAGGGAKGAKGGKAGAGRGRKAASAHSNDLSASVASAAAAATAPGASDWRKRARAAQQEVPLGVKIKAVVDYLRGSGEPQRAQAVAAATGFDPQADQPLHAALRNNSKVDVGSDGQYTYRPEVANVRSKHEVLDYMLRRARQGEGYAALGELQDAYPGVVKDLEELKREGLVLSLPAAEASRKEVYYPIDQRLYMRVDADVQELWQSVGDSLPDEEDELRAELLKIGLKPAPRQVVEKREARAKKRKARKVRRLTKVTNLHLKHLLEGDAPTNIETA